MARASRKFVLDSHLFIHAFRDPPANLALQDFHILAVMARAEGLEVGRVSKAFANGGG